ncbi:MAG: AbrB/MazE/SpoVT family DNA-binding domain-containing protein [Anaerolineae bacterium]|nr:AbrB/MazE/SpoVT family DNA-binding domain-containing protein [Anaerolineae bacterium]
MTVISKVVRPLRSGQITIPAAFRRALGIDADTLLRISINGNQLRIEAASVEYKTHHDDWFKALYEEFAPARNALVEKFSEEELDQLIDTSVQEVRKERDARRA